MMESFKILSTFVCMCVHACVLGCVLQCSCQVRGNVWELVYSPYDTELWPTVGAKSCWPLGNDLVFLILFIS